MIPLAPWLLTVRLGCDCILTRLREDFSISCHVLMNSPIFLFPRFVATSEFACYHIAWLRTLKGRRWVI